MCKQLLQNGDHVVATCRAGADDPSLQRLQQLHEAHGSGTGTGIMWKKNKIIVVAMDVADESSIEKAFEATLAHYNSCSFHCYDDIFECNLLKPG